MNGQSSHSLLILIRVGICNLETERVLEQGLAWDCMGLLGITWDYLGWLGITWDWKTDKLSESKLNCSYVPKWMAGWRLHCNSDSATARTARAVAQIAAPTQCNATIRREMSSVDCSSLCFVFTLYLEYFYVECSDVVQWCSADRSSPIHWWSMLWIESLFQVWALGGYTPSSAMYGKYTAASVHVYQQWSMVQEEW